MILFFTDRIENDTCYLDGEESLHCVKVLRKRVGDKIVCTDGKGRLIKGVLSDAGKKSCKISIEEVSIMKKPDHELTIAIAPTKNISRFEWFLEKAVEIGITRIIPVIAERSERKHVRLDRLKKVIRSAVKQSMNLYEPQLMNVLTLKELLTDIKDQDQKFIAHYGEDTDHLKHAYEKGKNALVLIGPEGDFTPSEIKSARENGFIEVILGNSRLRTETAGIVACHIISMQNG